MPAARAPRARLPAPAAVTLLLIAACAARLPAPVAAAAADSDDPAVCNGVRGLCALPVRQAMWLGTHNSLAIYEEFGCPLKRNFANQAAPVLDQIAAGARVLNIDADLRQGRLVFGHGLCVNAKTLPGALFDQLGSWLSDHPSESLVLHFDDNGQKDDPKVSSDMHDQIAAEIAASRLGPLVRSEAVAASTLVGDVRGRAVVVFDALQWGGGGDATTSRGTWLKAWGEASSDDLYASDPSKAAATRDAVAAQLLARFKAWGPAESRCGQALPFRSWSFGSGDWMCAPGAGVATCQLALLAAATNDYAHLASAARAAAAACGSEVGPPAVNVLLLDFFPPPPGVAGGQIGGAGGPRALVDDLNRAAVLKYEGCSWGPAGRLACPGLPPPAAEAAAPVLEAALVGAPVVAAAGGSDTGAAGGGGSAAAGGGAAAAGGASAPAKESSFGALLTGGGAAPKAAESGARGSGAARAARGGAAAGAVAATLAGAMLLG
ncbi:MAG: PLC-like phosphodiesterase [Monoraphidium minutum]|nr:MAG: PLC-like phosphodiesterase [Monoraphidium minutum]